MQCRLGWREPARRWWSRPSSSYWRGWRSVWGPALPTVLSSCRTARSRVSCCESPHPELPLLWRIHLSDAVSRNLSVVILILKLLRLYKRKCLDQQHFFMLFRPLSWPPEFWISQEKLPFILECDFYSFCCVGTSAAVVLWKVSVDDFSKIRVQEY